MWRLKWAMMREKKMISITSHTDYTEAPTLVRLDRNDIAVPNTLPVMVDGQIVQPKAYTVVVLPILNYVI